MKPKHLPEALVFLLAPTLLAALCDAPGAVNALGLFALALTPLSALTHWAKGKVR